MPGPVMMPSLMSAYEIAEETARRRREPGDQPRFPCPAANLSTLLGACGPIMPTAEFLSPYTAINDLAVYLLRLAKSPFVRVVGLGSDARVVRVPRQPPAACGLHGMTPIPSAGADDGVVKLKQIDQSICSRARLASSEAAIAAPILPGSVGGSRTLVPT